MSALVFQSEVPTPYATHCVGDPSIGHGGCGQVFMTEEAYNRQMRAADSTWRCVQCGYEAMWDDDNYESYFEEEQEPLSNCCGAHMPDYAECDLCPACKEHCDLAGADDE